MNLPLNYNILQPKTQSSNPPLLVMLHGYGSDENDLFSFAEEINQHFLVVSLKAPIPLPFGGNAWYEISYSENAEKWTNVPQAKQSLAVINDCINIIKKEYKTSNTYLLGFSQGAILSYALSLNNPENFKGVLALSGYLDQQLITAINKENTYPQYFASHGTEDAVIPVEWARKSANLLNDAGIQIQYTEYQMGHGINPNCFNDLQKWIREENLS